MKSVKDSSERRILAVMNGFWGITASKIAKKSGITYAFVVLKIKRLLEIKLIRPARPEECRHTPNKRDKMLILTPQGIKCRTLFNQLNEILNGNGN